MDIEGDRLRLRGLREDDEPALLALLADPRVTQRSAIWAVRPVGHFEIAALLNADDPALVRWGIEDRSDGALAGMVWLSGIDTRDRHAEIELLVGPPDRWGRGLGTEALIRATAFAFAHLSLLKVSAEIPVALGAVRAAAERAGYEQEGTLIRQTYFDGDLVDVSLLAAFADQGRWPEEAAWT